MLQQPAPVVPTPLLRGPQRRRRASVLSTSAVLLTLAGALVPILASRPGAAAVAGEAGSASTADLLVVGTGRLGRRAAEQWRQAHPEARVVAATRSRAAHDELRAAGLEPVTVEELEALSPRPTFGHVLFAVPPGGAPEPGAYAGAVAAALEFWKGGAGSFVFTSSASVFAEDSGGEVTEESPLSDRPGPQRLLAAEQLVADAGGTALRLAGLYDLDIGPHAYWLKVGVVKGPRDGLINMLHYDDAACAAVAALALCPADGGRVLIVADGEPVSRHDICKAALHTQRFGSAKEPSFEEVAAGEPSPPGGMGSGKRLLAGRAREQLVWRPRYASFAKFMAAH